LAYTNVTSRTDAAALVPEEVSKEMLGKATEKSAVLQMFRPVPVGRAQVRFPVLSPSRSPTSWRRHRSPQTTEINWANKFMNVEEIAAIMPVPDNVIADVDANIWDEAMPLLAGGGRPHPRPGRPLRHERPELVADERPVGAHQRRQQRHRGLRGHGGRILRRHRRPVRQGRGRRLRRHRLGRRRLRQEQAPHRPRLAGPQARRRPGLRRRRHPRRLRDRLPDARPLAHHVGSPRLFGGDWSQFVVGVRQDITWRVLDQAVIQDNTGAIVYNLAQQKMVALNRFRVGGRSRTRSTTTSPPSPPATRAAPSSSLTN
jgi:hypothetical protein